MLAAVFFALVGTAEAAPFQRWLDESAMPAPEISRADVVSAPCHPTYTNALGCAVIAERRIEIRRSLRWRTKRLVFLHEAGHLFDAQRLDDAARQHFQRLVHRGFSAFEPEVFAELYAHCALWRPLSPRYVVPERLRPRTCRWIRGLST